MRYLLITVVCLPLLAIAHQRHAEHTFAKPYYGGYRLDSCAKYGELCGFRAADSYCRMQGYHYATDFRLDYNIGARGIPTRSLSGVVCRGHHCDSFSWIRCRGRDNYHYSPYAGYPGYPARPGYVKQFNSPSVKGRPVDWCVHWGKDCGYPAARYYCQGQGYRYVHNFQKVSDVGPTYIQGDRQLCRHQRGCDSFRYIACR